MNTNRSPFEQSGQTVVDEALLDQIERELVELTTTLPGDEPLASPHCVDEFSNEFLNWSMPPRDGASARPGRRAGSAY